MKKLQQLYNEILESKAKFQELERVYSEDRKIRDEIDKTQRSKQEKINQ